MEQVNNRKKTKVDGGGGGGGGGGIESVHRERERLHCYCKTLQCIKICLTFIVLSFVLS